MCVPPFCVRQAGEQNEKVFERLNANKYGLNQNMSVLEMITSNFFQLKHWLLDFALELLEMFGSHESETILRQWNLILQIV